MNKEIVHLTLRGRIPSKKNSRAPFANRGRIPLSDSYLRWTRDAAAQLLMFKNLNIPKAEIQIEFYFPDNRRVDLDNKATSILDLLKGLRIIEDDCWQCVPVLIIEGRAVDKEDPRADIWIKRIPAEGDNHA